VTKPRPESSCEAFDGWVTRADFRPGTRVWGQNGTHCQYSRADTTLICKDPRKRMALATTGLGFWTISLRSDASWHYHHV